MRNLLVHEFLSIDGVMQAPGSKREDTDGGFAYGGWTMPYWHDDIGKKFFELMQSADTLLLGRKTWQIHSVFETMHDPFATALNATKKIVVSTSLKDTSAWRNSSIISQNVVPEVKKLKATEGKNILVDGSSVLLKTLIKNNLVDMFYFHIYPVVLGDGKKIFPEHELLKLKLDCSKQLPTGVIFAQYHPVTRQT